MSEATSKKQIITKIEVQKKNTSRYNIYLNQEYAFPVDEAILIKYVLHKGMELDAETIEKLVTEDTFRKFYNRALVYISHRLRSEKEVFDDLKEKEATPEVAYKVIEKLKEQKYIDDQMYGESYVRTSALIFDKGPMVIKQELKKKGLNDQQIEQSLFQYDAAQMQENSDKSAAKVWKRHKNKSCREATNKVKQHLYQKGFPAEVITQTLLNLDTEKSEEDEYEALKSQGEKLWRKQRRLKGNAKVQKVKSALYQKGFSGDLINVYIEEQLAQDLLEEEEEQD